MPEHRIRLRAGWELCQARESSRIRLPTSWPSDLDEPVRLVRDFGRPPIDPLAESLSLELESVPGLIRVHLNGVELGPVPEGFSDGVVPLEWPLPPRNHLVLDVDVSRARRAPEWGTIALVIAPRTPQER